MSTLVRSIPSGIRRSFRRSSFALLTGTALAGGALATIAFPAMADGGKGGDGAWFSISFSGGSGGAGWSGQSGSDGTTDMVSSPSTSSGGGGGGAAGGGRGGDGGGGDGGGRPGQGGHGGTEFFPDGRDGETGYGLGDGGGGGGGGYNGNGPGTATLPGASLTGGRGGKGAFSYEGGGGGGGAGGFGAVVTGGGSFSNAYDFTGGGGGRGGSAGGEGTSQANGGGGGGDGGVGLLFSSAGVTVWNAGRLTGGAGGDGGWGWYGKGGDGGVGGAGITFAAEGATLHNSGMITGGTGGAGGISVNGTGGDDGDGGDGGAGVVFLGAGGVLVNTGTIAGGARGSSSALQPWELDRNGAGVWGTDITVTNSGAITGVGTATYWAYAVVGQGTLTTVNNHSDGEIHGGIHAVTGDAAVTNAGLIEGIIGAATPAIVADDGRAIVVNSGSITGSAGAIKAGRDGSTVFNAGTLGSGGSVAVQFTGGSNTLTLAPTSVINGRVQSTAGGNLLQLGGTGSGSFDVSRLGDAGQYRNFGALRKIDASTWTLTGTATFAGTLDIAGGTLVVEGDIGSMSNVLVGGGAVFDLGGTTQTIAGGVMLTGGTIRNGTLASATTYSFDAGTISAALAGSASLDKHGAGTLVLAGANTYTGPTAVAEGKLVVNGSIAASAVSVASGAVLGGGGTVGATTVAAGGTLAPGNSIGTLTVAGDVTFAAGSRYEVEVDPAGTASDRVVVSGTATIDGGTVAHIGYAGAYKPFSTYRILTAGTGLVGAFAGATSDFAFLTPALVYDYGAFTVDLTLTRNEMPFEDKAGTGNQRAAARAAESLGVGQAVYDAFVGLPDDAAIIQSALDSLSGEVHASLRTALIEDSAILREAVNDRLRAASAGTTMPALPILAYAPVGWAGNEAQASAPEGGLALWGRGFGSWGHTSGDGNAARLERSTGGFLVGADAPLSDTVRLGVLGGYGRSSVAVKDRASSASSDNYYLGLYGGRALPLGGGELGLRAGLAYTWHDIGTSRSVTVGTFSDSPSADYAGGTLQAFGEAGYRFAVGRAALEPFAGLAYVGLSTESFGEWGRSGTGGAALVGAAGTTETVFATLGLRAGTDVAIGAAALRLSGTLGWRHAFGEVTPFATNAFAGGVPFTVAGTAIARDAAVLGAELSLALSESLHLAVAYDGQIAARQQDHGFSARLAARF